jgi:hypothetical protein
VGPWLDILRAAKEEVAGWSTTPTADWLGLNHDLPFESSPWVGEVIISAIKLENPRYVLSGGAPIGPSGSQRPTLVNWRDFRRLRIIDVHVVNDDLTVRSLL